MATENQSVFKTPGAALVAIVAVIYGLGVAFGGNLYANDAFWDRWLMWGAVVVGALFVLFIVLPWISGASRRR